MTSYDKIAGSLFGLAIGDALGKPTEFLNMKMIHRQYGRTGPMELPSNALVTDDTHMMLYYGAAVVNVMVRGGMPTPTTFARAFRTATIAWLKDPENKPSRAPGNSCLTAAKLLSSPAQHSWTQATTLSLGCGANMRVAPISFIPQNMISNVAQQSAAMTHGHARTLAVTDLTAWLIRWAADGAHPSTLLDVADDYIAKMIKTPQPYHHRWLYDLHRRWEVSPQDAMRAGWRDTQFMMRKVRHAMSSTDTGGNACVGIGEGWEADSAIGTALYCAMRHGDDPLNAVSRGARTSGDSDSIACLAGAIVGAYHGLNAWPIDWVNRIEFSSAINRLALDLSTISDDAPIS